MAHEELQKQYKEDCKHYKRPWELWEFRSPTVHTWTGHWQHPTWHPHTQYRRKEPSFTPEYFSGLNWREAEKYVGKEMEFSDEPDNGWSKYKLLSLAYHSNLKFDSDDGEGYEYCRTCPETFAHSTIRITVNGKDYDLPKPETKAPKVGTFYYTFSRIECPLSPLRWGGSEWDELQLEAGIVHLTEDRAQAWADWWKEVTSNTGLKSTNSPVWQASRENMDTCPDCGRHPVLHCEQCGHSWDVETK